MPQGTDTPDLSETGELQDRMQLQTIKDNIKAYKENNSNFQC